MAVRGWDLDADWSRQGHYGGTLEDLTSYVQGGTAVTVSYGVDLEQDGARITSGSLAFALNNRNRVFSPRNTSSPINGRITPGVPFRFQKTHLGQIYTLFTGPLDDYAVDPDSPARTFSGTVLDAWGKPGAEVLSTPVYQGQRTGFLINVVLDAIGWTGPREIDAGATYVAYWWEEGTDAATAIQKLVDSEGPSAIAYVQGGTFVFHDRHHRLLATASQGSQGTFTHIMPAGTGPVNDHKILKGSFEYNDGLKRISNAVVFEVEQRRIDVVQSVWSTDDSFALAASETVPIDIQPSDPVINAVAPRAGIDYLLLSGTVTVTLSRTSGGAMTLYLAAGPSGAVIQGMAVTGQPIKVARTVKVTEEDAASIARVGRQTWGGTVPWANIYDARVIAQKIIALFATERARVSFTVANVKDATTTQMLARKPSDRITIRNDAMGINSDFVIERVTHTVRKLLIHTTTFDCQAVEPTQPANVFTFDKAGAGFDQGAFGINGVDAAGSMFRFDTVGAGFDQGRFAS